MKQCDRCKEWEAMGLSDTCPACDAYYEGVYGEDESETGPSPEGEPPSK